VATVFPSTPAIAAAAPKTIVRALRRWVLAPALVALALAAGYAALNAFKSPGYVIRRELVSAGAAMARMPWSTPTDRVRERIARQFVSYRPIVDARGFPAYVTVTLHGLGGDACGDAERLASRIEGDVVIVAEGRAGRDDCRKSGAMSWRIMP
jgi:hypothetical protein